ncbi:DUF2919 family protein [Salmonella enterica]|nr:DUF2919 family protein [Salmonella enterica]
MKHLPFCHPGDFDDNGLLKAPVLFWVGLVVMARAGWLMGAAMTTQQGGQWLAQLYPGDVSQWLGLFSGLPSLLMVFCYPVRGQLPFLARGLYLLMLMAVFVTGAGDCLMMRLSPAQWEVGWFFLCLDVACMVMLWPDRWLRAVFSGPGRFAANEGGCATGGDEDVRKSVYSGGQTPGLPADREF